MNCTRCGNELKENAKFCPKCGGKLDGFLAQQSTPAAAKPSASAAPLDERFKLDKYLFNQKFLKIRQTYQLYDENQNEIFFIQRTTFALKRHISIFSDSTMKIKALTVLQDKVFAILFRTFTLQGPDGQVLGSFRRRNMISILRRTWDILSPEGAVIAQAFEDSWFKALLRRFSEIGDFLKTDFIIQSGGAVIGKFIRKWTVMDKYVLDLTGDPQQKFDRRLAVALGVLLDSAEHR